MASDTVELFARMTLHEFLLEIECANLFASTEEPAAQLTFFRETLLERMGRQSAFKASDVEMVMVIQMRVRQMVDQFCDNVAQRMVSIRRELGLVTSADRNRVAGGPGRT